MVSSMSWISCKCKFVELDKLKESKISSMS